MNIRIRYTIKATVTIDTPEGIAVEVGVGGRRTAIVTSARAVFTHIGGEWNVHLVTVEEGRYVTPVPGRTPVGASFMPEDNPDVFAAIEAARAELVAPGEAPRVTAVTL